MSERNTYSIRGKNLQEEGWISRQGVDVRHQTASKDDLTRALARVNSGFHLVYSLN